MIDPPIRAFHLPLPFRMGSVNCCLLGAADGFILVDTGGPNSRKILLQELEGTGCQPGSLRIILLTHGDFDHTGNAAFLRQAYACPLAMHSDDAGMADRGDMFVNRKQPNALIRWLVPRFTGFGEQERFTPDVLLADGDQLSDYGLAARVVSIPGHSLGSIGLLTAGGDLFCGDLLTNQGKPALNCLIDDPAAASASLQKLDNLRIATVYPGHGEPFAFRLLEVSSSSARDPAESG